jgi:SAM-dependent methyltransferase
VQNHETARSLHRCADDDCCRQRGRFCNRFGDQIVLERVLGFLGGAAGVRLLKALSPTGESGAMVDGVPPAYRDASKLEVLLGRNIWDEIRDKVVVDFGCGEGHEVVELAKHGARRVIGIENYPRWFASATERIAVQGVADRCRVVTEWTGAAEADVIISLDSFEHFEDPAAILRTMHRLLKPGGCVITAFGPLWYHPYGGHLFSVFPYAHLVFSEHAMVTWRSTLPGKEPKTSLLDAGLNKMTVKRFEQLVRTSPFTCTSFEAVPIRRLRRVAHRWWQELTTSVVRCRLSADSARVAGSARA